MDPNEVLRRLREAVAWENGRGPADSATIAENACAMAQDFDTLDVWLRCGGFLPADWNDED